MDPKDGRLRIGDPFGPARPSDDDESSSWPSPTSRGTKRGRDIVGGSDATERSERFVADLTVLWPLLRIGLFSRRRAEPTSGVGVDALRPLPRKSSAGGRVTASLQFGEIDARLDSRSKSGN